MRPSPCTPTRAHVGQQDDRHLPDFLVQAGGGQLGAGNRVGLAQQFQAFLVDRTDDADAQAGARERLAHDDLGRQAKLLAHGADLVLEERAQRLDQLEVQVLGKAADVVVALDVRGTFAAAGFDDVRVQGALDQELHRLAGVGCLGEDRASRLPRTRG